VENPGEVRLYDAGNALIATISLQTTGNNGLFSQEIGPPGEGIAGVARAEFHLNGSCAIDDIEFSFPWPEEEVGEQLWFLNGGDGTVTLVSLDGDPLGTLVVPGQSGPTGVAVSPDGVTWVTFHDSDAVVRFDLAGSAIGVIPMRRARPGSRTPGTRPSGSSTRMVR
jgi:streptogramin lyase